MVYTMPNIISIYITRSGLHTPCSKAQLTKEIHIYMALQERERHLDANI